MSRLESVFSDLRAAGRQAVIPYITAGDPQPDLTVSLMHALADGGADVIELGVPFSDPMADGTVIQAAHERALVHGLGLRGVLAQVREFRQSNETTPVVLMGYQNPIEAMGLAEFARQASESGVDGVLTVDMPPEEADELAAALQQYRIDPIFLIAPTTAPDRIKTIAALASGFVYYVSLKGVTGSQTLDVPALGARLDAIRAHTDLPVGVGFGIRDAHTAAEVAKVADAVVIGSALVQLLADEATVSNTDRDRMMAAARQFVSGIRSAMDAR